MTMLFELPEPDTPPQPKRRASVKQQAILDYMRSMDRPVAKAEIVAQFGRCYYCNGALHVGNILSRMVASGHIDRVKRGLFKVT
jgi:hypothetical protein